MYSVVPIGVFLIGMLSAAVLAVIIHRRSRKTRFDRDDFLMEYMFEVLKPLADDIRIPSRLSMDQAEMAFVVTGRLKYPLFA